jgi:hypothetical protein
MVLPSIRSLLTMWRHKFRFQPLTLEEQHHLEPHIVSPDFDSAQLVKKQLCLEDGTPVAHAGRALGCSSARGSARSTRAAASAPVTRGKRRGRSSDRADSSSSSSDEDGDWIGRGRRGGSKGRRVRAKRPASNSRKGAKGRSRRSAGSSSSSSSSEESSEEASGREYCPSGGDKSDTPSESPHSPWP